MEILSNDKLSSIHICEGEFDDPRNYRVTVSSHGFSGYNEGVFLLKKKQFLQHLRQLVYSGNQAAVLEGSENFRMQISPFGARGDWWLEIQVGKVVYFQDGVKSKDFLVTCGFVISGEYTYSLMSEFEALFSA